MLSSNTKMNLIYLISKKQKSSDYIRFVPYFYNHNRYLCNKFTSLSFLENH